MSTEVPPLVPDTRHVAERTTYSVLFAIAFSHLLNDTIQSLIPAIYPVVKGSFNLSFTQVGLITLVGLVAKNGILIVEFANHMQTLGLSKHEAVIRAAGTRLRPILMTSAATVFGHFPLVLVTGAGAQARNSIGIVLVSGMTISTAFTLFVVPCIYTMLAARHTKAEEEHAGALGALKLA